MLPYECQHLMSLLYCPRADNHTVTLTAEALDTMVQNKWFGVERKAHLLDFQKNANAEGVPLSVHLTVGGPPSKFHISVYEPKIAYYSKMGRVIVSYDTKKNNWHCPCSKPRQSCTHKAVAKWHLFVTKRELFRKVKSTETEMPHPTEATTEQDNCPDDRSIARMLKYLLTKKKLPADLPQDLITASREGRTNNTFPNHLLPSETKCVDCQYTLCEQLITSKGKILTSTGVVEGWYYYHRSCYGLVFILFSGLHNIYVNEK